ncbi:hypothetical protein IAU59_003549 [Kwoniella sp. CBS 9459]
MSRCRSDAGPSSTFMLHHRDKAPVTDEDWNRELACYARDREKRRSNSSASSSQRNAGTTSDSKWVPTVPPPQGPFVRPLVHHGDSDDSIEHGGVADHSGSISCPMSEVETATMDIHPPFKGLTSSGNAYDRPQPSIEPEPIAFDTAKTAPDAWENGGEETDDTRSAEAERRRMRGFYEKHGWLPAPIPNKASRLRRRRAIRRLGLVGEEEDGRKAVLSKYADMAQLIFNVPRSVVSVIHDEREYAYPSNPDDPPVHRPTQETACSHVIGIGELECWVIADWSKDWRTKNNPTCQKGDFKFFAAAPLRYLGKDGSVADFGTLNIYDTVPHASFDDREKELLLKLANMLVYQLATLQSEYMAKRSGAMYEASITFLRRSLLPEQSDSQSRPETRREGSRPSLSPRVVSKHPHSSGPENADLDTTNLSQERALPGSGAEEADAEVASKAGPRDSRDARRKAIMSDRALFEDAAETLRRLLKADAVVVLNMEDYQLFIRKNSTSVLEQKKGKERIQTKEKIIRDYMEGLPWPSDIEPVVTYVGDNRGAEILGQASQGRSTKFRFDASNVPDTLGEFLKMYLEKRHYWWDREDPDDELSVKIMDLMPEESQTALGTTFLGADGKVRFAMFATWNEPPSSLVDSSMVALPFVWILGGCLMAALAMKKMRALEQSQISYSNLQAHELRTPLHQILAITSWLRSSMTDLAEAPRHDALTTNEQIRDLLPFLDAIDTSGKTLHGIVDNILSFLDLKSKESAQSTGGANLTNAPYRSKNSLEVMFEELVRDAIQEDQQTRRANGQPICHIETIFEIIPPLLGEQVAEDAGGALRRALAKVLANAYKFIDKDGCVEIYVDDVPDLLPPEGCEDISLTRLVSIIIKDNGRGMDRAFVHEKLGEPWAKEDRHATGSGLSVHLAYRIIDLMGGCMEITSAPGAGTTVQIDVPLPVRSVPFPEGPDSASNSRKSSASSIRQLSLHHGEMEIKRDIALVGFSGSLPYDTLGSALERQYRKLGCEIVPVSEAELVIANGPVESETERGSSIMEEASTDDIVFLVCEGHSANPEVLEAAERHSKKIRRFMKPSTPSVLRETLFPNHSQRLKDRFRSETDADTDARSINTPNLISPNGDDMGRPGPQGYKPMISPTSVFSAASSSASAQSPGFNWKPRNMGVEEAVAALSLGEYFPPVSPKSTYTPQQASTASEVAAEDDDTPIHQHPTSTVNQQIREREMPSTDIASNSSCADSPDQAETNATSPGASERVKVLVVEDNRINRTILVKILTSNTSIDILQAEDGEVAVTHFQKLSGPVVVLLDINMPKKDGYQACTEMREIEKACSDRRKAEIIAVTALGSEEEKRRGLVECNFDEWYTKPCGKKTILKIVDEACQRLQAARC